MLGLAIWMVVGLMGGSAVAAFSCSNPVEHRPACGSFKYFAICGLVGVLLGALLYYSAFLSPGFLTPMGRSSD